jgi:hypothetical protein
VFEFLGLDRDRWISQAPEEECVRARTEVVVIVFSLPQSTTVACDYNLHTALFELELARWY